MNCLNCFISSNKLWVSLLLHQLLLWCPCWKSFSLSCTNPSFQVLSFGHEINFGPYLFLGTEAALGRARCQTCCSSKKTRKIIGIAGDLWTSSKCVFVRFRRTEMDWNCWEIREDQGGLTVYNFWVHFLGLYLQHLPGRPFAWWGLHSV